MPNRAAILLILLTLAACLTGRAAHAGGACSGLPWPSGASAGLTELAKLRGRDLDVRTVWLAFDSWSSMVDSSAAARKHARACGALSVGVPLVPLSHRGRLAECAAGSFDRHIAALGARLVANGAASGYMRLGYEMNHSDFAWAATGDGASWRRCYRRWVSVLRNVPGQRFRFVWNPNGRGSFTFAHPVENLYPGNAYVDVIGVDYYDRCPAIRSQADWDERYDQRIKRTGTPDGIGRWLAYAKAKGKKLAVPEWGIGGPQGCSSPGYDNPLYITNMLRFFRRNAAWIAYEAYFNGGDPGSRKSYRLAPTAHHPRAAAAYRAGWGR
jgi:hypothetical protein